MKSIDQFTGRPSCSHEAEVTPHANARPSPCSWTLTYTSNNPVLNPLKLYISYKNNQVVASPPSEEEGSKRGARHLNTNLLS